MIIISELKEIINQTPYILEFFVPGFISVCIFQIFTSRKKSEYQLILSVATSYILKAICSISHRYMCPDMKFSWSEQVIILTVVGVLLSILFVKVSESDCFTKLTKKINNKSLHDDIWRDVIDYKNGTTLRIISDDGIVYFGILYAHEEKGNDSWFVLKDYIVEDHGMEYKSKDMQWDARIAINLRKIKQVELYYSNKVSANQDCKNAENNLESKGE